MEWIEPERIKIIQERLDDGYYLQHWVEAVSDIMFLMKLYKVTAKREHDYWDAANKAELSLEEIEQQGEP